MNLTIKLPTSRGTLDTYRLEGTPLAALAPPHAFNRIAYSAAHVVADPLRAREANAVARHRLATGPSNTGAIC